MQMLLGGEMWYGNLEVSSDGFSFLSEVGSQVNQMRQQKEVVLGFEERRKCESHLGERR